ncbi:MAG TPA: hypothetical protein VNA11_17985, partial [Pseudonocardia sp.]|nr:hypothetical protein [Pseudonocardia sp.]
MLGSTILEINSTPNASSATWATNGQAAPARNSAAPIGGPASWLPTIRPALSRALAMPRSGLATSIGSSVVLMVSATVSAVPSRNIAVSTTGTPTRPVAVLATSTASTTTPKRVGQHDQGSTVHPIRQHPGEQPEQQAGQSLQQPGRGHQDRIRGLRGDQQRAGGHRDAVADVGGPGGAEQPPVVRAQPGRHQRLVYPHRATLPARVGDGQPGSPRAMITGTERERPDPAGGAPNRR